MLGSNKGAWALLLGRGALTADERNSGCWCHCPLSVWSAQSEAFGGNWGCEWPFHPAREGRESQRNQRHTSAQSNFPAFLQVLGSSSSSSSAPHQKLSSYRFVWRSISLGGHAEQVIEEYKDQ